MKNIIAAFFLLPLLFLFSNKKTLAQDSSRIRISLLTCTPGEELYSIFGHSAIRIIDSNNVADYVFNYGTFNFDDEDFYLKFTRGKLLYFVSIERSDDFINAYALDGRGITEQVLHFTSEEKTNIKKALIENLKEENKYYKYDFFLDNCTTRLRDIISKNKSPEAELPAVMSSQTKFREAIHEYLDKGGQYWSKLGIDLLLGLPADKLMTASEQAFLPDNLMKSIDSCKNHRLVEAKTILIKAPIHTHSSSIFTPLFVLCIFSLFHIMISLLKNQLAMKITCYMDGFIFFITGLLGILFILMWTVTDHSMTKYNFNLLWAVPTNTIACFFIGKKNKHFKKYFLLLSILLTLLILAWCFIPQQLNISLIPFVILLSYRSYKISIK